MLSLESNPVKQQIRNKLIEQDLEKILLTDNFVPEYKFISLPCSEGLHEKEAQKIIGAIFNRTKLNFKCYELDSNIFNNSKAFDNLELAEPAQKFRYNDKFYIKKNQDGEIVVQAQYINSDFYVDHDTDSAWADYCGTATKERLEDCLFWIESMKPGALFSVTFGHFPKGEDTNNHPDLISIKEKYKDRHRYESSILSLPEFFEQRIKRPNTLIMNHSYWNANEFGGRFPMQTLRWHLEENSRLTKHFESIQIQIQQKQTMSKNRHKTKTRTFATTEDLHDAIRDALDDGYTTKECAKRFNTTVGKCAAILANLNR